MSGSRTSKWETFNLGMIGGTVGGKTPSKSVPEYWMHRDHPWVSPKDMKSFVIRDSEDRISDEAVRTGGMQILPKNSVLLVTRSGILAHTLPIAYTEIETAINQDIKAIQPLPGLEPRYLAYALRANAQRVLDDCSKQGTTVQSIETSKLEVFPLPLAPLNEQTRIAHKLDTLLARVDACRDRLDRIPAILKRFRQSVLAAATSGKLTKDWREQFPECVNAANIAAQIHMAHEEAGGHKAGNAAAPTEDVHDLSGDTFPKGWELITLRDVVLPDRPITYGILKPGPELEEGVPYIRVADFPGEKLNLTTIRKTSPQMDEEFKRSRLRSGDLLLSIRGTVGRLVVIPDELAGANITQDSARLSVQLMVNRDYVLWYLRSSMAQDRMKGSTKGVAVRGINIGDVRALQLPLPSREEQTEIIRRVETLFAYADRLKARYAIARAQVDKLTPATLAKAFRGELVPQDPNDEPASKLLERIRTQRGEQTTAKPKRGRKGIAV